MKSPPSFERHFHLAALIALQEREQHPLGLPDALGDCALLKRVALLARLRSAVLERGYKVTPADRISGRHSIFPILELTELLAKRILPFRRTSVSARLVLAREPHIALSARLFRQICVSNHVNHESAHALLYELSLARQGVIRGADYVEVLLVSEAFAIAVEQFVALIGIADRRRTTALYLAANAYINPFDYRANETLPQGDLDRLAGRAVATPVAMLTMLATVTFLALARPTASQGKDGLAERLADLVGITELDPTTLRHALSLGLRVDLDFRSNVQRNFYEYLGLDRQYNAFISRPLESIYGCSPAFSEDMPKAIDELAGAGQLR